ncbi:hypothetical protein CCACVL1_04289 [Corchorus capsularis]|uniref:Uncharacterized protein n=1 Tax=Corchorus capsularis TaxID=210143 RepID=A0A1R3JTI8_COCAP|nr:hypothetical protein CCACVL1_04289 [Corchorus capsularis]
MGIQIAGRLRAIWGTVASS